MKKKSFGVIVLAAFCLTDVLLLAFPVRSYTPYTYDPWLDVNDDGKINLVDTFTTDLAYGTTGDPTKPVNVTTIPAKTIEQDLNISITAPYPPSSWGEGFGITNTFTTEGYDRMFVSAAIADISNHTSLVSNATLAGAYWY